VRKHAPGRRTARLAPYVHSNRGLPLAEPSDWRHDVNWPTTVHEVLPVLRHASFRLCSPPHDQRVRSLLRPLLRQVRALPPGRCCRRDIPGYSLPTTGDWNGPVFGQLGALTVGDDGNLQCHICGSSWSYLANHVRFTHALTAAEYKALFGLNSGTGLVGPRLRQRQQEIARSVFREYWSPDVARQVTPEQRLAFRRGQTWRLETRLDPANHRAWSERSRRRYEAGLWISPALIRKAAGLPVPTPVGRGRPQPGVRLNCAVCSREFEVPRYRARQGRKVCGESCRIEAIRRAKLHDPRRLRADDRVVAGRLTELHQLDVSAMAHPDWQLICQYYGLFDHRPRKLRELGETTGQSPQLVRKQIRDAIQQLLGPMSAGSVRRPVIRRPAQRA
jgi:hypothetical protein